MDFQIGEEFLTSVSVTKFYPPHHGKEELTDEELLDVIRSPHTMSITSSQDHEEFTKLRNQLGDEGYIKIERGWWNGDRVTKPFTLNGVKFKKGEQFSCACAMGIHLEIARKYSKKKTTRD